VAGRVLPLHEPTANQSITEQLGDDQPGRFFELDPEKPVVLLSGAVEAELQ
jgi:hypothetical protein